MIERGTTMSTNDGNRECLTREQEDFVDVVANVGGKALEGAKVGSVGGSVGALAGAALGGAVGAAQTVQADREKASAARAKRTRQTTSSVSTSLQTTEVPPNAAPITSASVDAAQQKLSELISVITKLIDQAAPSSVTSKNEGQLKLSQEDAPETSEVGNSSCRDSEPDDSEASTSTRSADRRLERAAAVRAAKSVAAINAARTQQQQAAKTIVHEQRKLAALGVVPARLTSEATAVPKQTAVISNTAPSQDTRFVASSVGAVTGGNQSTSAVSATSEQTPPMSPEVKALLDQLAAITPLLALAVQRTTTEVVSTPDPTGVIDPGFDQSSEKTFGPFADETFLTTTSEEFEKDDFEDQPADDEVFSALLREQDVDDGASMFEWMSDDEVQDYDNYASERDGR